MIRIKSIYDPVSKDDGVRVLVTRYWPRGVRKEKTDHWLKELGTEPDLIKVWKAGRIGWEEFEKRYRAECKSEEKKKGLEELKGIIKGADGRDVTLLCTCGDGEHCHREILKEMLQKEPIEI